MSKTDRVILNHKGEPISPGLTFSHDGNDFFYRQIDHQKAFQEGPATAFKAISVDLSDKNNAIWVAMAALAEDIYSRNPEGGHKFFDLVSSLDMHIVDVKQRLFSIKEILEKTLDKK